MASRPSHRVIIFLVSAVQFVNILDFMIVMPLGPDFAHALNIPTSKLGIIGGAYTAAAAVAGLAGSAFLDRFDRRKALAVSMLGLVIATAAGGFSVGEGTLVATRVLAGVFGGPATSLSYSNVADVIPSKDRGRAMGAVMGAFSVASVLGVPAGLELARQGGWRMPFFAVAAIGLLVTVAAIGWLPSMRGHIGLSKNVPRPIDLLRRPLVVLSYAMTATVMLAGFAVIPNISAYVQQNLGYPRDGLGILYLVGGGVSFFVVRLVGVLVDRFGSFRVGTFGTLMLAVVLYVGFIDPAPPVPVLFIFVGFMVAMSFRNLSYNTLTSKVPEPHERAQFMSLQSAVQHLAAAGGAFLSAQILRESPDKRLVGMEVVASMSVGLSLVLPILLWAVESRVRYQEQRTAQPPAHEMTSGLRPVGPGVPRGPDGHP
jgi:predicted MFS family arabinose efflux permease